jgi:hypothetical protein
MFMGGVSAPCWSGSLRPVSEGGVDPLLREATQAFFSTNMHHDPNCFSGISHCSSLLDMWQAKPFTEANYKYLNLTLLLLLTRAYG